MSGEHQDVKYIKEDNIGGVISKGIACTYYAQPANPVDYFANWLLNYSKREQHCNQRKEELKKIQQLKDAGKEEVKEDKKEGGDKKEEKKEITFTEKVEKSQDLRDELQSLADHLKDSTKATGVYIGNLVKPKKQIQEDDDEDAHIDPDAQEVIHYIHANEDHKFIIDQTLSQDQGLTHDVFKEQAEGEGDAPPAEEGEGEGDGADKEPKEVVPNQVLVPEVVRENRMHFFRVPKLGSYLAMELKYDSCLNEDSLDEAYKDYIDVEHKKKDQKKERVEWEEKQAEEKENREAEGGVWEPQEREWPEILPHPFKTKEEKYVVCLDTMGQDQQFTEAELDFVRDTIKHYSEKWFSIEDAHMKKDIDHRFEIFRQDREFIDKEGVQRMQEEDDKKIEEHFALREDPIDDDMKSPETEKLRYQILVDRLSEGQWKEDILSFKNIKVIKFRRFFQSLFYFLGAEREDICESHTNKLCWRKACSWINDDLFVKIKTYSPYGPKDGEYKKYQLINFILKNIESIQESDVKDYSYALGRLYKWLKTVTSIRKDDILQRRAVKKKMQEERDAKVKEDEDWQAARQAALDEEKAAFDAKVLEEEAAKDAEEAKAKEEAEAAAAAAAAEKPEGEGDKPAEVEVDEEAQKKKEEEALAAKVAARPKYNEEEFHKKWNEEKPPVEIPAEVVEDIDNDYIIGDEPEE